MQKSSMCFCSVWLARLQAQHRWCATWLGMLTLPDFPLWRCNAKVWRQRRGGRSTSISGPAAAAAGGGQQRRQAGGRPGASSTAMLPAAAAVGRHNRSPSPPSRGRQQRQRQWKGSSRGALPQRRGRAGQQGKAGCRRTAAGCCHGQGGLWHAAFRRRMACAVCLGGGGNQAMAPAVFPSNRTVSWAQLRPLGDAHSWGKRLPPGPLWVNGDRPGLKASPLIPHRRRHGRQKPHQHSSSMPGSPQTAPVARLHHKWQRFSFPRMQPNLSLHTLAPPACPRARSSSAG